MNRFQTALLWLVGQVTANDLDGLAYCNTGIRSMSGGVWYGALGFSFGFFVGFSFGFLHPTTKLMQCLVVVAIVALFLFLSFVFFFVFVFPFPAVDMRGSGAKNCTEILELKSVRWHPHPTKRAPFKPFSFVRFSDWDID